MDWTNRQLQFARSMDPCWRMNARLRHPYKITSNRSKQRISNYHLNSRDRTLDANLKQESHYRPFAINPYKEEISLDRLPDLLDRSVNPNPGENYLSTVRGLLMAEDPLDHLQGGGLEKNRYSNAELSSHFPGFQIGLLLGCQRIDVNVKACKL